MDEERNETKRRRYYSQKKLWLQIIGGQREDEESYNRQERLRDSPCWKVEEELKVET